MIQIFAGTTHADGYEATTKDDFVLGGAGDDRFSLTDYSSTPGRDIDGGSGDDTLIVDGTSEDFQIDDLGGGLSAFRHKSDSSWTNLGTVERVEGIAYRDGFDRLFGSEKVQVFGGKGLSTASITASAPTYTISHSYDYAVAGAGAMTIKGTSFPDILYVGRGDKTIAMGDGNDIVIVKAATGTGVLHETIDIDGGKGADAMYGGRGNEVFHVEDARDIVHDDGGTDTVRSTISYELAAVSRTWPASVLVSASAGKSSWDADQYRAPSTSAARRRVRSWRWPGRTSDTQSGSPSGRMTLHVAAAASVAAGPYGERYPPGLTWRFRPARRAAAWPCPARGDPVTHPGHTGGPRREAPRTPVAPRDRGQGPPHRPRSAQVSSSDSQRRALRLGMKQYSPPRLTTNAGTSVRRCRIGRRGMVNWSPPSFGPTSGSFSSGAPKNTPLLHPLGLHELELALQVRHGGDEDDSAVGAVVLQHPLREHRAVAGAAPDHAVQASDAGDGGIARIHPPGVRARAGT